MTTRTAAPIIEGDWIERDNFSTYEEAEQYAKFLSRKFPVTPYRIVTREDAVVASFGPAAVGTQDQSRRFVVEYIAL
jgi:hypothetical protein